MNALIRIKGTVLSENAPPDVIEVVTAGSYITRGGKHYISYLETDDSGLAGVKTTVKVEGEDTVTLLRSGSAESRLIIARGKRQFCSYGTGYGDLMVGISGCHINSRLGEQGGEISFDYTIDINSSTVSQNAVTISVREAEKRHAESHSYGRQ